MILMRYGGRLGNNMFQYAYARIMAEMRECEFATDPGQFHLQNKFPNAIEGAPFKILPGTVFTDETQSFDTFHKKLPLLTQPKYDVCLTGYFQKWEYYQAHESEIKQWFYLPPIDFMPGDKDVIVHFRRDDYIEAKSDLNFEYYRFIFQSNRFGKVYFTGDVDDKVKKEFSDIKYIQIKLDEIDTLRTIKKFKNIIMSNSTFVWWGAFLSNAKNVWCPLPDSGYWSKEQTQDLFIPEKWIQVVNIGVGN